MKRVQDADERQLEDMIVNWVNGLNYNELEIIASALVNTGGFSDLAEFQFPIPMTELADEEREPEFNELMPYFTRINVDNDLATSLSAGDAEVLLRSMVVDNANLVIEDAQSSPTVRALLPKQIEVLIGGGVDE